MAHKKKVAVLGYGSVGKFLCDKILNDPLCNKSLELSFVWNRSLIEKEKNIDLFSSKYFFSGISIKEAFNKYTEEEGNSPDLIVEVCHPQVIKDFGELFLSNTNLLATSITALADETLTKTLKNTAIQNSTCLYLPSGAAWGINDIARMGKAGSLEALSVTMKFHADALRLNEPLKSVLKDYINDSSKNDPLVLYKGKVKEIAALAPNNVNTMTCLALAFGEGGLQKTNCTLIAHKDTDAHIVEIEATGKSGFKVKTERYNPAKKGAVTGTETYNSFLISVLGVKTADIGLSFC